MTSPTLSNAIPDAALQGSLQELRAHMATRKPETDLESLLWKVSSDADQILNEHAGMSEDLLRIYEQLGIVFEVIRNLSTMRNESEVAELFLASLRRSFSRHIVSVLTPNPQGGWEARGDATVLTGWLEALIQRSRSEKAVIVDQPTSTEESLARTQIMVGPVFAGDTFVCVIVLSRTKSVPEFHASDMSLMETLTLFCGYLISTHRLMHELRQMSITMVRSLVNAVDQKDEYTSGHSLRVGYYATLLGKAVNFSKTDLQMLQWSALLHDVGKIGIRDEVLKKQGKLTAEEFDHIKEHPVRSHKVVAEVPQLSGALDGVLHHHEHYDGTGYPDGMAGEDIPLQARIVQIADVFDALTSNRSYRAAYEWEAALEVIAKEAGTTIDPKLAKTFDRLIRTELKGGVDAWERLTKDATNFGSLTDCEGD